MPGTKPFLGTTTTSVSEAFPEVLSLELRVTQDPDGYYSNRPGQNVHHFTLHGLSRHIGCLNRRCVQGGLDLQNIVRFFESGKHEFGCQGHEGTPKGRNTGDSCTNRFKVELKIERKPKNLGN